MGTKQITLLTLWAILFFKTTSASPSEKHAPHNYPGASLYHNCYFCHSLKPNVQLTGPSLADVWGKPAAQVEGFGQYTDALKKSKIIWNEKTLTEWISNPSKKVPGTTMILRNKFSAASVKELIEFLKVAMGPNGYEKVLKENLEDEETVQGELQDDVSHPKASEQVTEILHCGSTIQLKYADGSFSKHWEVNISFRADSSSRGPKVGKPVRVETGSLGDRFYVVFRSSKEFQKFIKPCPGE